MADATVATTDPDAEAADPEGDTEVPASDPEVDRDEVGVPAQADRGWWRYPPTVWLGILTAPIGLGVFALTQGTTDVVAGQFVVFVAAALLVGPVLAVGLGSLLCFGTVFWGSLHYRSEDTVAWNPSPALYLVGAVLLTPPIAGGIWFVQRVRHVGSPDFSTWI